MRRTTNVKMLKKRMEEGSDARRARRRGRLSKAFGLALALGVALFTVGAATGWPVATPVSRAAQAAGANANVDVNADVDAEAAESTAPDTPQQAPAEPRPKADSTPGTNSKSEQSEAAAQEEVEAPIVRSIRIRGNEHISAETIFEAIKATRVGEPFSQESVMTDFQSIYNLGYFTPDITADVAPDGDGVAVIFQVNEFLVSGIDVSADEALDGLVDLDKVSASFSLQPGDVVDPAKLNEDLSGITDFVWSEFGVLVHPDAPSITQGGVVTVNLVPIRVRNIDVEGNEKTQDYVILRELKVKPGSIVRRDRITEDGRNVLHLGFFNEVIPLFRDVPLEESAAAGEAANTIDLVFQVDERKTGEATFGAGWSSQGIVGEVSIADNNFLGRGEGVELSAAFGKDRTTYNLGFYEPYLTAAGTSFRINVYNEREEYTDPNEDRIQDRTTGGNVSLGHPLGDYTRGDVTLRIDGSTLTNLGPGTEDPPGSGTTRSLTFSTRTDTSDHPFFPTEGFRTNLSAEFAGGLLGGDHEFNKYQAEMVKYLRVGSNDQSLAFRLRGGVANPVGSDLPIQEVFRVGGSDTVRGYDSVSGTHMVVANAEYRFNLTDGIQGVVFTDVGDAWEKKKAPTWEEMNKSAGLGVRLDTPIGILRIDYGWGDEGGKASFSLGPSF